MFPIFKKVGIKRKTEREIYQLYTTQGRGEKEKVKKVHGGFIGIVNKHDRFSRQKTEIDITTRTVGGMNDLTHLT